jgi:hypothetical protein
MDRVLPLSGKRAANSSIAFETATEQPPTLNMNNLEKKKGWSLALPRVLKHTSPPEGKGSKTVRFDGRYAGMIPAADIQGVQRVEERIEPNELRTTISYSVLAGDRDSRVVLFSPFVFRSSPVEVVDHGHGLDCALLGSYSFYGSDRVIDVPMRGEYGVQWTPLS